MRRFLQIGMVLALACTMPVAARSTDPVQAQLVDQHGHRFTLASLRATPLVVTFIATHCTQACPLVNAQIGAAVAAMQREHHAVRFVTLTLDPEHDRLPEMRREAKLFGADPKTWIFATGSVASVHAVMRAFGVVAEQGHAGYAEVHSTFVYLVDTHDRVRKTLLASSVLPQVILSEVHRTWPLLAQ